MRTTMVRLLWIALSLVLVSVAFILWSVGDRSGGSATGARLERMRRSPQWNADKGRFDNRLGRHQASVLEMSRKFFFGGNAHRQPAEAIAVLDVDPAQFDTPPASGLRVTWLGHSTFLVEIDQLRVLIDPVWGERASPVTWAGPARFYRPPLPLGSLPKIDVVLISHDHYDHLDSETIKALSQRELRWLVPLGVGAHLERWGVPPARVQELDWWEQRSVAGVTLTATPARHFSGRFIGDQNATLWVGWALEGAKRRLFYSGDTALHPAFKRIGEELGPFDLTLMEAGAYNQMWPDVHLGPEQAVLAHKMVRGRVMMPAHWGLFDLAMHGWTEPAERVIAAANKLGVALHMVRPGGSYDAAAPPKVDRFWPTTPWATVEEVPVWSTEVEALQTPLRATATGA